MGSVAAILDVGIGSVGINVGGVAALVDAEVSGMAVLINVGGVASLSNIDLS